MREARCTPGGIHALHAPAVLEGLHDQEKLMKYLIATAIVLVVGYVIISFAGCALENALSDTSKGAAGSAYIASLEGE